MTPTRRGPQAPPAPWGSFPLSELAVLVSVGLAIYAFALWGSSRALWAIGGGAGVGSLAGLEIAIREHFAGYRSHATLLAGVLAVTALTVVVSAGSPLGIGVVVGSVLFVAALSRLTGIFARRRGTRRPLRQAEPASWGVLHRTKRRPPIMRSSDRER